MAVNRLVLLVGGVGGAKLAYGLSQILSPGQLTVIVNTGDDFWHYGLKICPDLDTIMYTLSNRVDKQQGWGIANDTTQMLTALNLYGEDTWFRLGDIDLATHLLRTHLMSQGQSLSQVMAHLADVLEIDHAILPMTDDEVATVIDTVEHGEMAFQTYFVRERWQPTIKALNYQGATHARASSEALDAIASADAIVVGPSNPWLSIAPMLAVSDLKAAILARDVPRVAVSPIVGGKAIKGPTAKIMRELEIEPKAVEVALYYGELINGFVYDIADDPIELPGLRLTQRQTVMKSDHDKIALAESLLNWIDDGRTSL
jgi:LPPG:FO 2-phospho-L-lactate transferase